MSLSPSCRWSCRLGPLDIGLGHGLEGHALRFPALVLKDRLPDMVLAVGVQGLDGGGQILAAMGLR